MLPTRIKKVLAAHPHWGPTRIAEELGTTRATIATTASQHKIRMMTKREIEDWGDKILEELHGKAE